MHNYYLVLFIHLPTGSHIGSFPGFVFADHVDPNVLGHAYISCTGARLSLHSVCQDTHHGGRGHLPAPYPPSPWISAAVLHF